jgi:hypothetical protein
MTPRTGCNPRSLPSATAPALTLAEADRLGLRNDVHFFTLHERLQTNQIASTVNDVAQHVELFFETLARDDDRSSDVEHEPESAPSPLSTDTDPFLASSKWQSASFLISPAHRP